MAYLNDCVRKLRAVYCCCRQQFSCFSSLCLRLNKNSRTVYFVFALPSWEMQSNYGAAVPLFRFAFYVYRHSGRTGGVPVTIGIAPPSILMAGRSHCLRRFYHARTVTERKFHYIQIIAAEPPRIYWTLLCLRR